ncbi:MAG: hypothetical protein K0Q72_2694, partial [Armatimonadetes bacterium]|nr:hypothetical protein [Armatimonadota bacterium]
MMSSPLPARGWIRVSIVLAVLLALSALGFNGGAVSARTQWQRGARLEAIRTPFSESVAQMGRRDLQWRAQILAENIPPSALANPVEPWEGEEEEREREREGRANAAPQGFFQAATVPTPQTIGSAFQGFGMQDQVSRFSAWSYPPDTSGAIGPNHFVQVINGSVAFYNKSGVAAANPIRLNTFFNFTFQGVTYPRNGGFDPRVVYDRQSGRWFACALEFGPLVGGLGSANHLLLAVSRSSDPTTIWDKYVIPVGDPNQVVGGNQIASFTDYPTLGMDSNGVYAVVRIFAFNVNTGSVVMTSAKIVAMPKASLLAASPSLGTLSQWARIQDMFSTPQPALNLDPVGAGDPAWLFSSSPGSPSLLYRKITWSGGTPQLSNTATLPTPVVSLQIPSAPASGSVGANAINTGDVRLQSATIRGGRLWTSRNVCVNANGTHSGSDPGNRTACEWFEINVSGSTPTLVQNGRVWDPATADPWFYYFPSIMVNGQGHAVIAFSGSKNSEFVGAFYAGRLATDPPGTMGTPVVLRSGVAPYNQLDLNDPPRNRWGDYSYTSLDPSDTMSLWTIQEYAEAPSTPVGNPPVASRWGTRVARLASPPPVLDSPNFTLEQGQSNVTLPLTGTGFYDPGAGFTGRLSVQVGGGSPPGIDNLQFTYNGPTSITLRFDVAANAGGGPRSITVTNPDGQTATVASAFSVGVPATVQLSSST